MFLQRELKLELSEEKTLITHARTEAAKFLGYEVMVIQDDNKRDPSMKSGEIAEVTTKPSDLEYREKPLRKTATTTCAMGRLSTDLNYST